MNELIRINKEEVQGLKDTVNARELHEFTESKSQFNNWIKRRLDDTMAENGNDYIVVKFDDDRRFSNIDYFITLDLAKEISMLERNDKGREARKYFIECEKKLKETLQYTLPTHAEALRLYADKLEENDRQRNIITQQQETLIEYEPKVEIHDSIMNNSTGIDIGDFVRSLGIKNFGRNKMFKHMREHKLIAKNNKPLQKMINEGYLKSIIVSKGKFTGSKTVITPKGVEFMITFLKNTGIMGRCLPNCF